MKPGKRKIVGSKSFLQRVANSLGNYRDLGLDVDKAAIMPLANARGRYPAHCIARRDGPQL